MGLYIYIYNYGHLHGFIYILLSYLRLLPLALILDPNKFQNVRRLKFKLLLNAFYDTNNTYSNLQLQILYDIEKSL